MSSFSITRKKTPFKKRAEDETARLNQEFVESFQWDSSAKTFVRGGTINPNDKLKPDPQGEKSRDGASISKKGSRYVPSFLPPPLASKGKETENKSGDERSKERDKGKTRNIDHFMEELKGEQEMRERRNQDCENPRDLNRDSTSSCRFDELPDDFDPSRRLGSFDDGDPQSTNLYVGNLSPKVLTPNVPDITVVSPEDEHLRHVIDTMDLNVLDGGCAFEQAIMKRGRGNSLFNFLFELGSKEHTYYVWRLYSFAQIDASI